MLTTILIICLITVLLIGSNQGKGNIYINNEPKGERPPNPPSPQSK